MNATNVPIQSRTREKCCSDARAEMKSAKKCRGANASFLLSADVAPNVSDDVACPERAEWFQSARDMR
jgi:hypothetical protein